MPGDLQHHTLYYEGGGGGCLLLILVIESFRTAKVEETICR